MVSIERLQLSETLPFEIHNQRWNCHLEDSESESELREQILARMLIDRTAGGRIGSSGMRLERTLHAIVVLCGRASHIRFALSEKTQGPNRPSGMETLIGPPKVLLVASGLRCTCSTTSAHHISSRLDFARSSIIELIKYLA